MSMCHINSIIFFVANDGANIPKYCSQDFKTSSIDECQVQNEENWLQFTAVFQLLTSNDKYIARKALFS